MAQGFVSHFGVAVGLHRVHDLIGPRGTVVHVLGVVVHVFRLGVRVGHVQKVVLGVVQRVLRVVVSFSFFHQVKSVYNNKIK